MTETNPDEIRLNGLRLLAKMIASAYLRRAYQASGSELVTGANEAIYGDKRLAGYSRVAQAGQGKAGDKEGVDAGAGYP
jgi:hypothetical protein